MALIFDLVDPAELNGYVRGLAIEENRNRFLLSQFLPDREIQNTEFRFDRGTLQDEDAATFRSFDTESPIAKRQGVTRVRGQLPPISRKIPLGEEDSLRLRAQQTGDNTPIVNQVFDDAAKMTRSILARLELAHGEAFYAGALTIAENGVAATVTFGRSGSHAVTLAGADQWSDLANSDPIDKIAAWVQTYIDTNGVAPAFALTSTAVVNNLLRNQKIRTQAGSVAGTPQRVSRRQLDEILSDFALPPIRVYDTTVRVDGVAARVIPSDRFILMPPEGEPLGNTLLGITAEALELVGAGYLVQEQASGIVSVVMKAFDPVATWTKASAIALPVLANPDLTFAADVQ